LHVLDVDLQVLGGQVLEVCEPGEAGAEVVERDAAAKCVAVVVAVGLD
jgi:hypothetical protein